MDFLVPVQLSVRVVCSPGPVPFPTKPANWYHRRDRLGKDGKAIPLPPSYELSWYVNSLMKFISPRVPIPIRTCKIKGL